VQIPDAATELLQANAPTDVSIYTTITVAEDRSGIYANLLGPLVINQTTRIGVQLVQDSTRYNTRHRIADLSTAVAAA
jgi:flagellar assembly factor FliW